MIVNLYSVRDILTGFGYPFVQPNDDSALRNFRYMLTPESKSEFSIKPSDYSLFLVAQFDTDSGTYIIDGDMPRAVSRKEV